MVSSANGVAAGHVLEEGDSKVVAIFPRFELRKFRKTRSQLRRRRDSQRLSYLIDQPSSTPK